jgi:putative tryptophan/tyrosine transport system substrate-binding protein
MRRREFIAGLGSAAAWPLAASAQQGDRMRRVGVLMYEGENDPDGKARLSAFTQGVAESAWRLQLLHEFDSRSNYRRRSWTSISAASLRSLPVVPGALDAR